MDQDALRRGFFALAPLAGRGLGEGLYRQERIPERYGERDIVPETSLSRCPDLSPQAG